MVGAQIHRFGHFFKHIDYNSYMSISKHLEFIDRMKGGGGRLQGQRREEGDLQAWRVEAVAVEAERVEAGEVEEAATARGGGSRWRRAVGAARGRRRHAVGAARGRRLEVVAARGSWQGGSRWHRSAARRRTVVSTCV